MRKVVVSAVVALLAAFMAFPAGGPGEKVELNFLEVMTSPSRTAVLKEFIARYQADHPNVTINLTSPPYEQADNKLTMMLNAREPLDIVEVRDFLEMQFVNNKLLKSLEPHLKTWEYTKSLLPVTLSAARAVDNTAYYLPEFFYMKALFMRHDVLAKLGVTSPPATIRELYEVCKRITNPGANQYGFDLRGKNNPYPHADPLITSDIPNIDVANHYRTTDGKLIFELPQYVASLKAYAELYRTASPPDAINWGFNDQVNAFVSGITPFLLQDPDTIALLDEQLGRDKYTVVPMPLGGSGKTYLDTSPAGLAIPSYSKNEQAAWDFIAWFSAPAQNAEFNKKYGPLPNSSVAFSADPYFSTGVYKAYEQEMATPAKYVFVKYPVDSPKMPGWGQVHEKDLQAVLLGQMTAEEAAARWAAYWK